MTKIHCQISGVYLNETIYESCSVRSSAGNVLVYLLIFSYRFIIACNVLLYYTCKEIK